MIQRALCPYCAGKGCDRCKSGYIQVRMATGDLYALVCNACGKEIGGCIVGGPDSPHKVPPAAEKCPFCTGMASYFKVEGEEDE